MDTRVIHGTRYVDEIVRYDGDGDDDSSDDSSFTTGRMVPSPPAPAGR